MSLMVFFLLISLWILKAVLSLEIAVPSEMINLDHFREVLLTRDGKDTSSRSAMLVLYHEECSNLVEDIRQEVSSIISPVEFITLFHNEQQALKNTWYTIPVHNRLSNYFPSDQCPTIYFLKHGYQFKGQIKKTNDVNEMQHQNYMIKWDRKGNIVDWIWDNLKVDVTLVNLRSQGIIFLFYGQRVHKKAVFVPKESTMLVSAYIANLVTSVSASGEFFYGWRINSKEEKSYRLVVADFHTLFVGEAENDWLAYVTKTNQQAVTVLNQRRMCDVQRHLLNLKQPLLVKNLTHTGYEKMMIPDGLHTIIKSYYRENNEQRTLETWDGMDTNINQYDQRSLMVRLPSHIESMIYQALGPLLEKWCSCVLESQALYGIREYYHGHVLHNHVDRINTHGISAILQIDKDLDGQRDWDLEVIDYGGERQTVSLQSGEMLLYESAKLIHGRPLTFKGRLYANIFVHFSPKEHWPYLTTGHTLSDGNRTVDLWPL